MPYTNQNPPPISPSPKEFNCQSCSLPDTDSMVQCDRCNGWHHYQCVNVTDEIENCDWLCQNCDSKTTAESHVLTPRAPSPIRDTNADARSPPRKTAPQTDKINANPEPQAHSVPSREATIHASNIFAIQLQLLEEERLLKEQRDMEYLKKKYKLLEIMSQQSRDETSPSTMDGTNVNSYTPATRVVRSDEKIFVNSYTPATRIVRSDEKISDSAAAGKLPASHQKGSTELNASQPNKQSLPNYTSWASTSKATLRKTSLQAGCIEPDAILPTRQPSIGFENHQAAPNSSYHNPWTGTYTNSVPNAAHFHQQDGTGNLQTTGTSCNSAFRNVDNTPSNEQNVLSNQQLATRLVLQKELPCFSGQVEEWPLFINSFENSTKTCGFTNEENLLRLQRCLRGNALEAVRARLLYPAQVPRVIETLRMLYGRPEAIVNSLISKIRREPPPKADKIDSLIPFALSVQNIAATMEANGLRFHLENPCLLQELVDKLPAQTRLNWGLYKLSTTGVNLCTFSDWLLQVAQAACEVSVTSLYAPTGTKVDRRHPGNAHFNFHQEALTQPENKSPACLSCPRDCRTLELCDEFRAMDLKSRWAIIKRHSICRTCLGSHHNRRCKVDTKCNVLGCTYRHHQLLHKYTTPNRSETTNTRNSSLNLHQQSGKILFKILPITVYNEDVKIDTYALLDDGSNVTLIEEKLAQDLKVKGEEKPLCLKWTSNKHRLEENSREVNIRVSAAQGSKRFILHGARTVKSLSLPSQTMDFQQLQIHFPYLQGLPVKSYSNARPQILIGLDNCNLTNAQKAREAKANQPVAVKTKLGWTVFGSSGNSGNIGSDDFSYHVCECKAIANAQFDELVKGFYATENIGSKAIKRMMSSDDRMAERLLEEGTTRVGNRFSVPLLWKSDQIKLPDSRPAAEQRLMCLERKLKKDSTLRSSMHSQIEEYIAKGYARKLTRHEVPSEQNKVWYLPIFPVTNPNKPSKIRMVWDAAAKVEGVSLNTLLLTGPDNLPPLPTVLFQFRQRKFAICGDIKEMFHQVLVREADQHAQRFLWRNRTSNQVEDYVMQVMTFGSTCSPYCAQYAKNKNASEFISRYPRAAKAILENHYVDDYLDSFDSEVETIEVTKNVTRIHRHAGFELRNFMSNSAAVLNALQLEAVSTVHSRPLENKLFGHSEKVLGMWWSPSGDYFSFLCNKKHFFGKPRRSSSLQQKDRC